MAAGGSTSSSIRNEDTCRWTVDLVINKLEEDVDWTDSEVNSLLESSFIKNLDKDNDHDRFVWALIESKFNTPANWGFFRRTCAFIPATSYGRGVNAALDHDALENKLELLKGAVEMFGGTVKPNLDKEVTHCVCYVTGPCTDVTFTEILSSMDFVEEDNMLLQGNLKVVTHKWVLDCVRQEREVPVAQYEIPRHTGTS
ncbi:hypothetical protein KC19_VG119800 [Ceratodon purpureus]|uniref:BRCT domain-containing protein n=1 Tax=Ceratodon purpureus TaxID=3225 RepID=A0A8T0HPA5_CERPU|nr:hypothetical protein KC19_VG119800 [Ceratodon purpureus]